ncbi:TlpA family protein disulfide reductase [Flavobacterium notoginsengisoli]|uniref:TlpA family protein disulfide reductase n=1 Tax=Flavobacterium notoginsengisoli TaxID=1478199 RepID=UPI00363415B7
MKRIILTALAAFMLLAAQAQDKKKSKADRNEKLAELTAETDQKVIDKKLKLLLQSNTEQDAITALSYYNAKELTDKAEDTRKKILKKFPEGSLAQQELLKQVDQISDLNQKDQKFVELHKKYPSLNTGFLTYSLGKEFAAKGDENKMKFYADIMSADARDGRGNAISKESIYATMATDMVESNPSAAAAYLQKGVALSKKALDEITTGGTANENQLVRAKNNYFSMQLNYMTALANGQEPEKAYQMAKEMYDTQLKITAAENYKKESIEGAYVKTLIKTKRYKEALPLIETAVKNGDISSKNLANLKLAYTEVNGADADYISYEAKILAAQKQAFKEEVEKSAVNLPAPGFELKDTEGRTVKLSDFKDKVVVVDFWATWCGPCKASFPAMQKAVNKYKNDENVQFLFLHTWEKNSPEPAKSAQKYVTDNNYTFKVLMDLRDPKTKDSAAASAFKVDGIPSKFIIDPKGNIRFNTSGFSADADKAVEELSYMIEFARKG